MPILPIATVAHVDNPVARQYLTILQSELQSLMSDVRMLYSAPRITALLGRHVPACTQLARVSPGPRWV